ncbi:MAG: lamin tail domain-containing protein [Candidatus Yonathbacteria bacterium]|nr:lamin tail domain-containing protein [Candidatus Yonathbacteria bacterium]
MRKIQIVKLSIFVSLLFFARIVSAQVIFNEIQISPTSERFIEIYNSSDSDVDLTGWYIQRKTATGSSFNSLVTSTQLKDKIIKANGYFLVSRSQSGKSDIVIDNLTLTESNTVRIRDSKGVDIDQIEWATVTDGKSYQKMSAGEWGIATPSPGVSNNNTSSQGVASQQSISSTAPSSSSLSNLPVEPQIIAEAGEAVRTTLVGAPIIFSGKVFGLKKEPIENARFVWVFGDGARSDGTSVNHTYYYPGEYIVVLDASSGFYSASTRVRVIVSAPQLVLHTGGDNSRSFVSIENQSGNEVDLSGWIIREGGKDFIFPQHTILGARKEVSFASDVTGLIVSPNEEVSLHYPNGTRVESFVKSVVPLVTSLLPSKEKLPEKTSGQLSALSQGTDLILPSEQKASALNAFSDPFIHSNTLAPEKKTRWWLWYGGVLILGFLAFVGSRLSRRSAKVDLADTFEIIEGNEEGDEETPPHTTLPF